MYPNFYNEYPEKNNAARSALEIAMQARKEEELQMLKRIEYDFGKAETTGPSVGLKDALSGIFSVYAAPFRKLVSASRRILML